MNSSQSRARSKSAWVEKAEAKLEQLDARIALLKAKAKEAQAETRQGIHQQIDALEKLKSDLGGKSSELKAASAEAWEDVKHGMESAMQELSNAVDEAMARYR